MKEWELDDQEAEDRPNPYPTILRHFWTNLNYYIFKKWGYLPLPIHLRGSATEGIYAD